MLHNQPRLTIRQQVRSVICSSNKTEFKQKEPVQEAVADPGFSKWGGTVLSQMGGHTSCFQVKSA